MIVGDDVKLVTIFTPTYNRNYMLKRLYDSLLKQNDKNFEWVVVDDGSIDGTHEYIKKIKQQNKIKITYVYQPNSGKHVAINRGVDLANGEFFAIVDSDDYLTEDAVAKIREWFTDIEKSKKKFAGVAGQKGYSNSKPVGTTFNFKTIDAKSNEREKFNITGDKFEVFYTDVIKKNKFPVYPNEKFMTEMVVWNRIARQGYYIRWHQDIIYLCDYLDDGLTKNIVNNIKNSPKGFALNIREQVKFDKISFKKKLSYYSLYYDARKEEANLLQISRELNDNCVIVYLSVIIRKIYKFLVKNEKKQN